MLTVRLLVISGEGSRGSGHPTSQYSPLRSAKKLTGACVAGEEAQGTTLGQLHGCWAISPDDQKYRAAPCEEHSVDADFWPTDDHGLHAVRAHALYYDIQNVVRPWWGTW